jgi:putative ABC transport system ATP-binding protein
MAAVDKLSHLTELEIETEDGDISAVKDATQGARVDADKLGFTYPDGKEVFRDVCFNIQPSAKVALTGSQGSGCSTLLDLLLSMRQPTSGHVSIDGVDTRSWYLEELRSAVMLLRTADIVSGTIAENIRLGLSQVGMEQVQDALKQVGLLDEILSMPQGMHTPLVTGGLPLSSRQRTRLLLARALIQQPRLLLLDDVFDGMDTDSTAELAGFILAPERSWTVIITSRDPAILKHCSLTINMDDPACHSPE